MRSKGRAAWHARPLPHVRESRMDFWLRDRGSLTAHLQARGEFSVKLLRQGLSLPTSDEARALGIANNQLAWVREVALYCDSEPLVFAHTVLPYHPRGPLTGWFSRLGNQSLGALLFAHPGFSRGRLDCRRLDPRHPLFARAIDAMNLGANLDTIRPTTLWARRSRFGFGRQAVLVTEVFAPAIIDRRPETGTKARQLQNQSKI